MIHDKIARAIRAPSLRSSRESMPDGTEPTRTADHVDVLGACGVAGNARQYRENGSRRPTSPLGIALVRLLSGDNSSVRDVVSQLAAIIEGRAWRTSVKMSRVQAEDMARSILAWHRDGACRVCHGHGYQLIDGAPALSDSACPACNGTAKMPFGPWPDGSSELAAWTLDRLERDLAGAGSAVMDALAPRMDL